MSDSPAYLRGEAERVSAGLPALMLSAERLGAALLSGSHGMRRAGAGEEFWQYRLATAGDTARAIDWRRSARSDVELVRDREAQSAQTAAIWVSRGQGMDYSGAPSRPTKGHRARVLALAIAIALLRGSEKAGLAGEPPRAGRRQAGRIAAGLLLRPALPPGDDDIPPATALRPGQRVLLISDFLGDPGPVLHYLAQAASQGVRGAMLQVLDPDEMVFPFSGAVLFRSASGALRHDTRDAAGLRDAYLARLHERRALLGREAQGHGWHFGAHDTGSPAAQALLWISSVLEG